MVFRAVPAPGPIFICPTKTKRKIRLPGFQHAFEGHLKDAFAVKPVIVETETMNSISFGKFHLLFHHCRNSEVIKPQVGRQMRLIMTFVIRLCLCNVCPFSESFSPPEIVFRNWMILRQVKSNEFDKI